MPNPNADRLFKCELPATSRLGRELSTRAAPGLERLLWMDRLNTLYDTASAKARSSCSLSASPQ